MFVTLHNCSAVSCGAAKTLVARASKPRRVKVKRIFAQKKRASLNNSDRQELVGKVYCVLPNKQAGVAAFKHA